MSNKLLNAAGLSLALIGAAAMPLQASAQTSTKPEALVSSSGMTVVRDAVTGQLRGPTDEERAALEVARSAKARNFRVAPKPTMQRFHPNGAHGARLTDEFMSTSIAIIKPDGTLDKQCYESKEAADAALDAASTTHTLKLETE
jgi:hypothetical protein